MWGRRLVMAVVLTLATTLTTAPPAMGAGPGQPFYGDVNGDGRRDRLTVYAGVPGAPGCFVSVAYGRPGGGYLPPVSHRYTETDAVRPHQCPDMGTVADLRGDGRPELLLAFSDNNNLTPYRDIVQPTFIGSGRFSTGGRTSPFVVGTGGVQNFTTTDGVTWRPGPIGYCSSDVPKSHSPTGPAAVSRARWSPTPTVVTTAAAAWPDLPTTNRTTGEVDLFINDATNAPGLLVQASDANTRSPIPF